MQLFSYPNNPPVGSPYGRNKLGNDRLAIGILPRKRTNVVPLKIVVGRLLFFSNGPCLKGHVSFLGCNYVLFSQRNTLASADFSNFTADNDGRKNNGHQWTKTTMWMVSSREHTCMAQNNWTPHNTSTSPKSTAL